MAIVLLTRLGSNQHHAAAQTCPNGCRLRATREDATRTQNSTFGIRNLRKPRELSQPNQLDMVGEEDLNLRPLGPETGIPESY